MRYTKKPVTIEAWQNYTGDPEIDGRPGLASLAPAWMAGLTANPDGTICIQTLEGAMLAGVGDWIIRGVRGELYPCKPDIFAATYERERLNPIDKIEWDGPAESWVYPFTRDQRERLSAAVEIVDDVIPVFAIGPDAADLILSVGPHDSGNYAGGEDGDEWKVRFGRMRLADFKALPEHQGW